MLLDFITIPDFFDDPEYVYNLAMKQTFYPVETHPLDSGTQINWNGTKTLPLDIGKTIPEEEYRALASKCITKIFKYCVKPGMSVNIRDIGYSGFFASLLEKDTSEPWMVHSDTTLISTFVYLQKEKPQFPFVHGTTVIVRGKPVTVNYEYNTCVIFRSDLPHTPNHGFGNTIENSRLTFNFFINSIDFSVKNNQFGLK
jgi:hypothetical protein